MRKSLTFLGQQMGTQQSSNNSDVGFENRDVDVRVEVGPVANVIKLFYSTLTIGQNNLWSGL
jgi:hypothetical protein